MGIFTGKRVVLVGPAPHIVDRVQDLSGYDLVCRVGLRPPLSDEIKKCTSDRFDVWFPANQLLRLYPKMCLADELKIIRTSQKCTGLIPLSARNKISYINTDTSKLRKDVECCPNRGLKAMIDILSEDPAELYVTGLTFYLDGAYYNGYSSDKDNAEHTKKRGNIGNHKQEPQIEYFKKYIMPHIKMDWKLKELFSA